MPVYEGSKGVKLAATGVGAERERQRGRGRGEEVRRGQHVRGSLHPRDEAAYAPGECGSVTDTGLHFHTGTCHSRGLQESTPPGRSASSLMSFRMVAAWYKR